jgi:ankyrin repeat protein
VCLFRSERHAECVAYLLEAGADPLARSARGDTALHAAAKSGGAPCLQARRPWPSEAPQALNMSLTKPWTPCSAQPSQVNRKP